MNTKRSLYGIITCRKHNYLVLAIILYFYFVIFMTANIQISMNRCIDKKAENHEKKIS